MEIISLTVHVELDAAARHPDVQRQRLVVLTRQDLMSAGQRSLICAGLRYAPPNVIAFYNFRVFFNFPVFCNFRVFYTEVQRRPLAQFPDAIDDDIRRGFGLN
ncbi:MAG TPA: hypothetical protein VL356_03625 [Acidocella sp.]|nr:hypothetical protein [Acidocella sp.]